jgi:hypothetical protein
MKKKLIALFSYAFAMGYLEAAVVVYLRELFYPKGFIVTTGLDFSSLIYRVDLFRETATIVMLLAVAYIAFEKYKEKILTFLWIFAIWDLTYYLFLKVILNWPPSFKTLDVLFLIPVPWIAPVWFPVAVSSVTLLATTYLLIKKEA